MSSSRDRLVPLLAGGVVIAVAVSVVLLLRSAGNQGVTALTRAKLEQVQATADTFNARVASELTSVSGLGSAPWQLTPGSASDRRTLNSYNVDANASSGFFLVNASGSVTSGVLLRPGALGSAYEPSKWPALKAQLAHQSAVVLPITTQGLTTELPEYDFVVAIRGASSSRVRGALVFEEAVTATSAFETEIAQLGDGAPSSAAWFVIDSRGAVVATTKDTGLGRPVENPRYLTLRSGVVDLGSRIVITASVPSIGWRVIFRQNRSQFDRPLSGPLQKAGLILVLLLLAVGLLLVSILVRRLRTASEQQRRLRELTQSQADFISVVSHELRTPVAGILGFLQTTVDHWTTLSDADRLRTVRRAMTNAHRLQAMTRDVLDAESIDAGRLSYRFTDLNLTAELQSAADASTAIDGSHPVRLATPPEPVVINADADRLQQVLANLLENARKNAPSSDPIDMEVEVVEIGSVPRVHISVTDRGPGIAPDSLERIFQKFARGNDNAVTGTGLGLYIARTIVESHHGRIWCESDPGQRTKFVVELPLARRHDTVREDAKTPISM